MQCPQCQTRLTIEQVRRSEICPECAFDFAGYFDHNTQSDETRDPNLESGKDEAPGTRTDHQTESSSETGADEYRASSEEKTSQDARPTPVETHAGNGSTDPRMDMLLRAHRHGLKVVTFIGFSNSGKTWLIRRVLGILNPQRDWDIDPDPDVHQLQLDETGRPYTLSGFLTDGERVPGTAPEHWFIHTVKAVDERKHGKGFLVADIAGESFSRLLEPSKFFGKASAGVQKHLLALLAVSDAFVFVVPATQLAVDFNPEQIRQEIETGGVDAIEAETHNQLRNSLSTFGNIANAAVVCSRRMQEEGIESLDHGFHLRDALADFKLSGDTGTVDRTMFLALSKADTLRSLALDGPGDRFDCDPVYFAARSMPDLLGRSLSRFRCVKVDFVTAFDRSNKHEKSIHENEVFYSWPHFGVNEMIVWILQMLEGGPARRQAWAKDFEEIANWRAIWGSGFRGGPFRLAWKRIRPNRNKAIEDELPRRSPSVRAGAGSP